MRVSTGPAPATIRGDLATERLVPLGALVTLLVVWPLAVADRAPKVRRSTSVTSPMAQPSPGRRLSKAAPKITVVVVVGALLAGWALAQSILVDDSKDAVVDQSAAASLFLGFAGFLLVGWQVRAGMMPKLMWVRSRGKSKDSTLGDDDGAWVEIVNRGLGPAVVDQITYTWSLEDGRAGEGKSSLVAALGDDGFVEETDYILFGLTPGVALGKDVEYLLSELPSRVLEKLHKLEVDIEYIGMLGGLRRTKISCLPA
jgi:hypothetical protein